MKIYKHMVLHILVTVFFTAAPSFAAELSDDEAYDRAYTVCSQTVYPFRLSKEGETFDEDRYALTPPRLQKIAACMREKGVPAAFDEEIFDIVPTGTGFGKNVDIKIEDLFPDDVTDSKDTSHRVEKSTLPDPDYTLPKDNTADAPDYDPLDAKLMRELRSLEALNRKRDTNMPSMPSQDIGKRVSPYTQQPPERTGTGGVMTGNDNSNSGKNDVKPIFLPR